eukprot:CAMPEP_0201671524 /NCGR_PEP_ID=MMETSP0494-20130426/29870_1 /ASSEMBLY_ACC=CAM_ASM_000839 /TAXON_ID=420259 /ORGANISM="Thalassiosira gravida, Strain GMp14c1" /LENGTH=301 /DNA_ID=CAMNT_0048152913 /DNA_START=80 /DNA_END=987 /DNA_ORIENTATION=+
MLLPVSQSALPCALPAVDRVGSFCGVALPPSFKPLLLWLKSLKLPWLLGGPLWNDEGPLSPLWPLAAERCRVLGLAKLLPGPPPPLSPLWSLAAERRRDIGLAKLLPGPPPPLSPLWSLGAERRRDIGLPEPLAMPLPVERREEGLLGPPPLSAVGRRFAEERASGRSDSIFSARISDPLRGAPSGPPAAASAAAIVPFAGLDFERPDPTLRVLPQRSVDDGHPVEFAGVTHAADVGFGRIVLGQWGDGIPEGTVVGGGADVVDGGADIERGHSYSLLRVGAEVDSTVPVQLVVCPAPWSA